jgi:cytochrome c oxidase cbb3-type subunit 3/ubiquinol-cytochrome c reductase cytochrome c subunit
VISYCACPHHVSGIVVDELRKRGYLHSAVLDEGIFVWQQQGNPVVAAEGQLPVAAPPVMGARPLVPSPGDYPPPPLR